MRFACKSVWKRAGGWLCDERMITLASCSAGLLQLGQRALDFGETLRAGTTLAYYVFGACSILLSAGASSNGRVVCRGFMQRSCGSMPSHALNETLATCMRQ
jgi:hypothetical protein